MRTGLYERVAVRLHNYRSKEFYFAFGLAVLAVLVHASVLISEVSGSTEVETLVATAIPYPYLVIQLGLIVNVIGLWLRTSKGIWLSIMALLGVGLGYLLWYIYSRKLLELLLSNPFYRAQPESLPHHPFGLVGATWLNLAVLLMSGVLFAWEVKTLRSGMSSKA